MLSLLNFIFYGSNFQCIVLSMYTQLIGKANLHLPMHVCVITEAHNTNQTYARHMHVYVYVCACVCVCVFARAHTQ